MAARPGSCLSTKIKERLLGQIKERQSTTHTKEAASPRARQSATHTKEAASPPSNTAVNLIMCSLIYMHQGQSRMSGMCPRIMLPPLHRTATPQPLCLNQAR
jgi:hypothetical protein